MRRWLASTVLVVLLSAPAHAATVGQCRFSSAALKFEGTPREQARCLLRSVRILGRVDAQLPVLPPNLESVVGQPPGVSLSKLKQLIADLGLTEEQVGGRLDLPLSRASNNDPDAPQARYFVIHDTSTPNFGNRPFPADLDGDRAINDLDIYKSPSNAKAHVFLNRRGDIYVGHGFAVPWRATKLENQAIGTPAKGLFLHIENVQPRRKHPQQADGNAPTPGFSAAQYDRLALLYVSASVRAGSGLIPAFHAALDEGLPDGHDDPQNFSLADFDRALGLLLGKVR